MYSEKLKIVVFSLMSHKKNEFGYLNYQRKYFLVQDILQTDKSSEGTIKFDYEYIINVK